MTHTQQNPRATDAEPVSNGADQNSNNNGNGIECDHAAVSDPLFAAESLRSSLRTSLSLANNLITAIKKDKKQSRLVRSTLASLKQLQQVG